MNEIQNNLEPKQSAGKRPPVEWKIKSVINEEQTVTILFPEKPVTEDAKPDNITENI